MKKERAMDAAKTAKKLTAWIKAKVDAAGAKGAVFGLSGGIDSAVIAGLCIRVFPKTSLGLIMPCHSIPEDQAHAELVAKAFNVPVKVVKLDNIVDDFMKLLPDFKGDAGLKRLAQANLKARMRMVTLYYTANQLNYLVVGSGNRSELTVGYFTKHGDSGVDILPIGNLVKKEVRELAQYLGVPQAIIDKAPSAGLWAGQTDEGEMGFTYEALDNYILTGQAPADLKQRIDGMNARSAHKREAPPVPDFPPGE
jgi:NAD+ synthase